MRKGHCNIAYIPLRKEPSHSAEQVSQLIYGEQYKVLQEKGDWLLVESFYDQYQGYIASNQFSSVVEADDRGVVVYSNNIAFSPGAEVVRTDVTERQLFKGSKVDFASIRSVAFQYLSTPYLWGGKTMMGIDCSGFVQMVFKALGIWIPRDSGPQSNFKGQLSYDALAPGDLAFFVNQKGKIDHVGICIEDAQIIHASGMVRVDQLKQEGIFNEELGRITHLFSHGIRLMHA